MTVIAYRFALDPTPAQERALRSHAGAARVAFNWGLARVRANLAEYGNRLVAGSGPETVNGRGADRKTGHARQVAVKRQPGTANAGKPGTAAPQGTAAA